MPLKDPIKRKEYHKAYHSKWYQANREKRNKEIKEYNHKNRIKLNVYQSKYKRLKRLTDPSFRLINNTRKRVTMFLKGYKSMPTMKLLDVPNLEYLWQYLEKKFKKGMTRENYGKVWHLDHIIPCIAFDPTNIEHQKICFHYTNLQPLFAEENLKKGYKIIRNN